MNGKKTPQQVLAESSRRARQLAERTSVERTQKILKRAQKDLNERLALALSRGAGEDQFTIVRMRATLAQLRHATAIVQHGLKTTILDAVEPAAIQASKATLKYLSVAQEAYEHAVVPLRLDEAAMTDAVYAGTRASALRRIMTDPTHPGAPGVLDRYGAHVVKGFEEELSVAVASGASYNQVRDKLIERSPFLKEAPAHWAERVARTESMSLNNAAGLKSIQHAASVFDDMVKILFCPDDSRTGCLVGSTRFAGGVVRAMFRRTYQGPMFRLVTESGRDLTTTPNHPMLTRRGWIRADHLCDGDELICDNREQNASSSSDENRYNGPSTFAEVFDSLAKTNVLERRHGRLEDFHGDGAHGNVDVLRPDDKLRFGNFAPLLKPQAQSIFSSSNNVEFCLKCNALLGAGSRFDADCLSTAANGNARIAQASLDAVLTYGQAPSDLLQRLAADVTPRDFFRRHLESSRMAITSESKSMGLGPCSREPMTLQQLGDESSMGPHRCRDVRHAQPCEIELDRLRFVEVSSFSGHVFNLSTGDGYFTAESIYTGNSDSLDVHGQVRRTSEPFDTWFGSVMAPPDRPNDRASVIPHRLSWPFPDYLKPFSRSRVLQRWRQEGRKGSPPSRPKVSTVKLPDKP